MSIKYLLQPFLFSLVCLRIDSESKNKLNENKKGMASAMPYSYLVTLTYKGKIIT